MTTPILLGSAALVVVIRVLLFRSIPAQSQQTGMPNLRGLPTGSHVGKRG
jgi:hypothetical protein